MNDDGNKEAEEREVLRDAGSRATRTFGDIDGHHWLCVTHERPGAKCDCETYRDEEKG